MILFAEEIGPMSLTGALVMGFLGMLGLQTWVIKFLLTDLAQKLAVLTEAIRLHNPPVVNAVDEQTRVLKGAIERLNEEGKG